jgi:hypothetical protein
LLKSNLPCVFNAFISLNPHDLVAFRNSPSIPFLLFHHSRSPIDQEHLKRVSLFLLPPYHFHIIQANTKSIIIFLAHSTHFDYYQKPTFPSPESILSTRARDARSGQIKQLSDSIIHKWQLIQTIAPGIKIASPHFTKAKRLFTYSPSLIPIKK